MIELTEDEARDRLEKMTQWDQEPRLTEDELLSLLELAKRADSVEIPPSEASWAPTWELNAAAAEGWRWKAGKVAGRFNVVADGDSLQRAQIFGMCLQMASKYAGRLARSVSLAELKDDSNVVANL
jgi:hypothetical protein